MPGEAKIKARPLRPVGAKYATKDIAVAKELATNLLHQALFYSQKESCQECDGSVMSMNGIEKNREFNERYDRKMYRKAVQYAIRKAQRAGVKLGNRKVVMWTPHQLRNTATTRAAGTI